MRLAKVIGQVVSTAKLPGLSSGKLTLVERVDNKGELTGEIEVACDIIGAGEGEWVLTVSGSTAGKTLDAVNSPPVDLLVVGIVDEITSRKHIFYDKSAS